jgi:hypothetical protein
VRFGVERINYVQGRSRGNVTVAYEMNWSDFNDLTQLDNLIFV